MKSILLTLIAVIIFSSCSRKKSTYEDDIKHFQYELNREFSDVKTSPLTKEDLKTFKGLDFFKIDKNYKIEATFELTPHTQTFEMQTTTTELQLYRKYAIARLVLNGTKMELSIYQSQDLINNPQYTNYLFLPFNDITNGSLSYGGGRFIDLEIPLKGSKTIEIDFNKAYNPYCAYNHAFSCPIPPSENNLQIAIPVGVKAYQKLH